MAAQHNINPDQLKLFMGANELQQHINFSYEGEWGVQKGKEAEARLPKESGVHGAGLYESISKEGMTQHVTIRQSLTDPNRRFISDMHHRVAAAAAVERDTGRDVFVPIEYEPNEVPKSRRWATNAKDFPQNVRND